MSNGSDFAERWRSYLSGAQTTSFPSSLVSENFDKDATNGTFSTTTNLTIEQPIANVTLIAAWALVISIHSLLDDIIFGLSSDQNGTFLFRAQLPEGKATTLDLIESVDTALKQLQALTKDGERCDHNTQSNSVYDAAARYSSLLRITRDQSLDAQEDLLSNEHDCPLVVRCNTSSASVQLTIEAKTNIHTSGVCRHLLEHFRTAIILLSSKASIQIHEIDLLGDLDFKSIQEWTATPEPVATQLFLHKLVEEQARLHPLSVAIGQTDSVMTYTELEKGGNALAGHLIEVLRSRNGDVGNVAIFFSKSAFAVLAMFAVLKAGGAFVPIDTGSPLKRIEKIIDNSDITAILCSDEEKDKLQSFNSLPVIPVTARSIYNLKKTAKHITPPELASLRPQSPAYIMHSSGSTGVPKGIAISHLAITTCMKAMARHFNTNESTRTLQFNALTFDVSVSDIWLTLAHGGRLCMPIENERFSLNEFIVAERCNFAHITPSVASLIDPAIARQNFRMLATIGEAAKPGFLRRYAPEHSRDGEMVLIDTWGPTEASVVASASNVTTFNGKTLSRRAGNVGKPVGCGIFIVCAENPNLLCPAYAPGEIALVGPTLASGYWGDEAKTKEAFRTDLEWAKDRRWRDKFGDSVMGRVYLTGDIGRFSEEGDGSVIFMYRRGGYVKVNGLRIDPGEVETAVFEVGRKMKSKGSDAAPQWEKNAVSVLEREVNGSEQQMLVCFVADNDEGATAGMSCERLAISAERRESFKDVAVGLRDIIPEYMVPSLFVPVTKMPFSTSDKLDRKTLLLLLDNMEWSDVTAQHAVENDRGDIS